MENIYMPEYFPLRWEPMDCTRHIYKMFLVHPGTEEYCDVVYNMSHLPVGPVFRIQHPLAYMRYIIDGEKTIYTNGSYYYNTNNLCEEIVYHTLHVEDLQEAISVNCDVRYYKHGNSFTTIPSYVSIPVKKHCLMLLKRRGLHPDMTRGKNHYPMYVILFNERPNDNILFSEDNYF